MELTWKKGWFSSTYQLLAQDQPVGELKEEAFSRKAVGKMQGKAFQFRRKGVFSSEVEVTDLSTGDLVGTIKFNTWGNKAKLTLGDQGFTWKYDNFWGTKCSLSKDGQPVITYQSAAFSNGGKIEATVEHDLLLLCGLFVLNHYAQLMIVVATSTALIASGS